MKAALLEIAINDYPGRGNDLRGCQQDMHDRRILLELMGFDVVFKRSLFDAQATLQLIRSHFQELSKRPEPALVVNMSGHGATVPDTSKDERSRLDSVFVNHDFQTAGFLLDDEIGHLLDAFPQDKLILLNIDACHSAGAQRSFLAQTLQTLGYYKRPVMVRPRVLPAPAITEESLAKTAETRKRLRLAPGRGIVSTIGGWLDSKNGIRYNNERVLYWGAARQSETADDAFIEGNYRGAASWFWGEALKTLIVRNQRANVKELPSLVEINKLANKLLKQAGHNHQMQIEGREVQLKDSLSRLIV